MRSCFISYACFGLIFGLGAFNTSMEAVFFFLNSWGWGWGSVAMDGLGRHVYIPETENVWQSYCMSLGCDELMGRYDMGRVGMVWYSR